MAENSKIEWTHHTFNPWIGCAKVHTGCTHCYAEEMMDHRYGKVQWGPHGTRVRTSDANWRKPIAWNKAAAKAGERHRVFCASLADVFEDWSGPVHLPNGFEVTPPYTLNDTRRALFALIDATPHLDWLLLTKRPENVCRMWTTSDEIALLNYQRECQDLGYRSNVWIGTSISDQATADESVPRLLECRNLSPVLFLSAEPLVGIIRDIDEFCESSDGFAVDHGRGPVHRDDGGRGVNWVIVGGESGHGARACDVAWIRRIVSDCESIGVPVFVKQLGSNPIDSECSATSETFDGSCGHGWGVASGLCHVRISDNKGGATDDWPADLRVREFPTSAPVAV